MSGVLSQTEQSRLILAAIIKTSSRNSPLVFLAARLQRANATNKRILDNVVIGFAIIANMTVKTVGMQENKQGWQAPTLRREAGRWRIYSDSGAAFVPLDKASEELVAACPGAGGRRDADDNELF